MSMLALARVLFPVTTLGPGRRVGIWFQGCSIRCPGCISIDTWPAAEPATAVADLLAAMAPWLAAADGVTITGGEPFDQPDALDALLAGLRAGFNGGFNAGFNGAFNGDILVYSGYPIERLRRALTRLDGRIDALVSDPFDATAGDRLSLRGSDNQRLHRLTALGEARFAEFDTPDRTPRALDLMADAAGPLWLAGIPRRGDLARLRRTLAAAGTQLLTSEHPQGDRP
jgi:anaerobic ribonucleoside-triphosphate reductase activating protein